LGGTGKPGGGGTTVIPFGPGMERPKALSQEAPTFTREAIAAHISGLAIVKCIITTEGGLQDCKLIKGLPHMDEAILKAVSQWKYTPIKFQGRAVSVSYTINVNLVAP